MYVTLENPDFNDEKQVKVGFSWTIFFFGFITLLFRRMWLHALIKFIICSIASVVLPFIGWIVIFLIYAFIANRLYAQELINKRNFIISRNNPEKYVRKACQSWNMKVPEWAKKNSINEKE